MQGDHDAFAFLVSHTSDRMYAIATRILRDPALAEDATQAAYLSAWSQLRNLRDADRFEAWLRKLVVHSCYAESRRRTRWSANVRTLPDEGPPAADTLLSVGDRDALDRAFRRLSVEHRAVFVLHHHVGLELTEIARTLGIADGTARSRLHRATRALREAVIEDMAPVAAQERTA